MDDSCAVCADNLEWVAYGSCGHREVCSTCVVRLRFVLGDPRCCICKSESPIVFVTKVIRDFLLVIEPLLPNAIAACSSFSSDRFNFARTYLLECVCSIFNFFCLSSSLLNAYRFPQMEIFAGIG